MGRLGYWVQPALNFAQDATGVTLRFASGQTDRTDLLIGVVESPRYGRGGDYVGELGPGQPFWGGAD
jgi:hypothetical protein